MNPHKPCVCCELHMLADGVWEVAKSVEREFPEVADEIKTRASELHATAARLRRKR
jgi:hypothetical protein